MEFDSILAKNIVGIQHNLMLIYFAWNKYVEKKKLGGKGLFKRKYDYDLLSASISEKVENLCLDWLFLDMFVKSMLFSRDASQFLQLEIQVAVDEIETVADEIFKDTNQCANEFDKYCIKGAKEMLSLLQECQRKTCELLKQEIQEALKNLSESEFNSRSPDSVFIEKFVPYVGNTLKSLKVLGYGGLQKKLFYLHHELLWIHRYLDGIQLGLSSYVLCDPEIDAFLTYVASVVLRITVRSCAFWFNRKHHGAAIVMANGLVDLHKKIDPENPKFIMLNLGFLKSLNRINFQGGAMVDSGSDPLSQFCSYLLVWLDRKDLQNELMSLVTLIINNYDTLQDDFFLEIGALLAEVAFSHRMVQWDRASALRRRPCLELLTKICLLQAELFFKLLLNTGNPSMLFGKVQFYIINMILIDLRAYHKEFSQPGNPEYVKQSLELAEGVAHTIEYLHISHYSKSVSSPFVKHTLLQLHFRIIFFKAESVLTQLANSSLAFRANKVDQIQSLIEDLSYFKRIVRNKLARTSSEEEAIILQFEAVAREITLLSYSLLPDDKQFQKIINSLPGLLDKVKKIKTKVWEVRKQFPSFIFPNTSVLRFFDFLIRNIKELLTNDPDSIIPVNIHIEEALMYLESFKSFLVKVKYLDVELGELQDILDQIKDVAYKVEYVIESIETDGHLQQSIWLCDLLMEIRLLDQQVQEIHGMSSTDKVGSLPKILSPMVSRDATPEINEILFDLVDQEKVIVDRLMGGSSQQDIVSIVGMPGIGKTTLARKVYNNLNVMYHFHRRAWCYVSKTYSKRELLFELLSHFAVADDISKLSDDDLMAKLRRHLLEYKYLIVMDDLWDTAAWDDLRICLPDCSKGSRIVITSRHQDVILKIKPDSDPLHIHLLSDAKSWKLLESKVFKGVDCPTELMAVGMRIAQHCKGLPLAIVAISGLLQKLQNDKVSWEKILQSFSLETISSPENRCKEILELSYNHLPEHLKACFIYLGAFLDDKDILVSKLICLWMAEGFIQRTDSKSLEEVAEDFLMELINSSLVDICKMKSNGKVKTCRLHDLLRDLCQLKANEEKFHQLVTKKDKPYASFPDPEYDMDLENLLAPVIFEKYRLSFYVKRPHFINSQPSGSIVRSLMFFALPDSEPKCPYDISFICHNFKLLRVLDLGSIMATTFPDDIGLLIQLRYLAISGYMQYISPSISNLWKLETLVVKGSQGKVVLPETIWSMARLRHLHVNNHVLFNLQNLHEGGGSMENLVSFSTPALSSRYDSWRILKRLPNLRKLRCIFWQSGDSSQKSSEFIRWSFLTLLESLKIICYGGTPNSRDFLLPENLKELTLSKFCLDENHHSLIGKLPHLRVLKLHAGGFENQRWELRGKHFKELKFLELDTMNLVVWDASCDDLLLSLEQLVLRNCKDLKGIPFDFAYIQTLQKVEVHWCGQSVDESAEAIRDERDEIKVIITRL